ncbi:helix-turn-helix domain-containing protein [Peptococcus simiae]|uniref:Helix-turn-helix domain-containing protein n=1 Tax=Peptococcus simiae TaxID=1643805 RepID=A0ABW9GXS3_9FIRM
MKKRTIGEGLGDRRQARGLTLADLAGKTGITEETLASWEAGRAYPDAEGLQKIAEALDLGPGDLLADDREVANQDPSMGETITLASQAVGLAMGVAVAVLAVLGRLDSNQGFILLGLGLAATGVGLLRSRG